VRDASLTTFVVSANTVADTDAQNEAGGNRHVLSAGTIIYGGCKKCHRPNDWVHVHTLPVMARIEFDPKFGGEIYPPNSDKVFKVFGNGGFVVVLRDGKQIDEKKRKKEHANKKEVDKSLETIHPIPPDARWPDIGLRTAGYIGNGEFAIIEQDAELYVRDASLTTFVVSANTVADTDGGTDGGEAGGNRYVLAAGTIIFGSCKKCHRPNDWVHVHTLPVMARIEFDPEFGGEIYPPNSDKVFKVFGNGGFVVVLRAGKLFNDGIAKTHVEESPSYIF